MAHAEILTVFLHNSQLEAREAVTCKTDAKSVPEPYQASTKKPKRKRLPTNRYTEPQAQRLKQSGNTARDGVNGAAEMCSDTFIMA